MSAKTYRNFYIQVSHLDPETNNYDVRVGIGIPGGQPDFDEKETRSFDANAFVVESNGFNLLERLKTRDITTPQLFQLGVILSDLLLPGEVRRRLVDSLSIVRERKQCLRIRLVIEASELLILPWEYLYLEGVGAAGESELNFLALQHDISIVRHEAIDQREPRVEKRDRYKLVAALASPPDQTPLNIDEDRRAIESMIEEVGKIKGTGKINPDWVENATPKTLYDALRYGADIFHFAGHGYFDGNSGQIILDNDDHNQSSYYDAKDLAHLLSGSVNLAVLGACESGQISGENKWGGVASALVQAGVAAVVGSQFRLEDQNAAPLSEELYRGVLAGDTVDESVSNARRAIRNKSGLENRDWGALVLYLRVEDGVIFPRDANAGLSLSPIPRIAPTPLQTPLIGRDAEINLVQSNLRGAKYHFYGVYGVGKTSLATQLFTHAVKEDAFTDGYLWYRVGRGEDVSNVLEWIGAQFGDQTVAQARNPEAKINALRELLAERNNLLLGLDEVNESKVARAVMEAAGNCTVVLNGPKRLGLGESTERGVAALTPKEATHLFINLINRSVEEVDEADQQKINDICEKMGYLPLAIRLTALKHAEGESLTTIIERLEVAPSTIIEGHEEVSTIFATVYDDLQKVPAAWRVLLRLASFPSREAPLAPLRMNENDLDFFQAKDKLIALGIVSTAGTDRLTVHPLLGRLAHAQADKQMLAEQHNHVAGWLLNYAHENTNDYQALEREHRNLLAAFHWFDVARKPDSTIALLKDLFHYLRVRGYWQEAYAQLEQAKQFAKALDRPADLAWVHLHLGIILTQQGDYTLAQANFHQADSLFESGKDEVGRGQILYRRSNLSFLEGKLDEALELARESLVLMGEAGPARDRSGAHARVAGILATQGHLNEAREHYNTALEIGKADDLLEEQAVVHAALGRLFRKAGKQEDALAEYRLSFDQYTRIGHVRDMAMLELEMGYQYYFQGNYDEALKHFTQGLTSFELLKYKLGLALAHHALGNVAYSRARSDDELDAAEKEYQLALRINRDDLQAALGAARNLYQLAVIAQRRGRDAEAEIAYGEVEEVARREKDVVLLAGTLHQLGRLDLAAGNVTRASLRAYEALDLARKGEDRLTEVSALCLIGMVLANEGKELEAKEKLIEAQTAFQDLNAPEAIKIEKLLKELERRLSSSKPAIQENHYQVDVVQEGTLSDDLIDVEQEGFAGFGDSDIDVITDPTEAEAYVKEYIRSDIDVISEPLDPPETRSAEHTDSDIDVMSEPFDPPAGTGGGGGW